MVRQASHGRRPGASGREGGSAPRRVRLRLTGVVQGVGFRPFTYRLATSLGLSGFVRNIGAGAAVEVEGDAGSIESFLERLRSDAPPLARVERIDAEEIACIGGGAFEILRSTTATRDEPMISPDVATCDDCLAELFDPADRRYRYPFINCTNCGPRFTIVRGSPYDRAFTTMALFEMCSACRREYDDPLDRRFHAQPNACAACGPRVRLLDRDGEPYTEDDFGAMTSAAGGQQRRSVPTSRDEIARAAALLRDGAILAVKGLGGYHLACRADDEAVVGRLRGRKRREERPFALLVTDLEAARRLVEIETSDAVGKPASPAPNAATRALLSPERPIVLLPRRPDADVADAVAPGRRELGVMLPYTPLHHLLARDAGTTLVLTSGNVSDEPIAFRDDDALHRLRVIADAFLVHDREIRTRTDDSVVRMLRRAVGAGAAARMPTDGLGDREAPPGAAVFVRRSRGYVPSALPMPVPAASAILACGAHQKNTFCFARGARAWLGPHVGDLENYETLRSFEDGIEHLRTLLDIEPEIIAHDLHPEYLSTKYALDRANGSAGMGRRPAPRAVGVQHHHAHLAACLAEHGETRQAVGAIYDGTGYGLDGTIWGGEILVGDLAGSERAAHLWPVRLPGGEAAVREPWRMACAWLLAIEERAPRRPPWVDSVGDKEWSRVAGIAARGTASPTTTSMGRLFDAAACLATGRTRIAYEGQAAIELEAVADGTAAGSYDLALERDSDGTLRLDARPAIAALVEDRRRGIALATIAARFHRGVARATVDACDAAAEAAGLDVVVLSGGVFQNALLLDWTAALLRERGIRVLVPRDVPANDGGISYGQAAAVAAQLERGE